MARLEDATGAFLVNKTSRYIHHRFTIIPSDQQKLLGRPDAWDTTGPPNLPPKVLQDVEEAYIRRLEDASVPATPEKRHSTRLDGTSRQTKGHHERAVNENRTISKDAKQTRVIISDDSYEEEPIDWTPSPSQHKRAPVRPDELPDLRFKNSPVPPSSPLSDRRPPFPRVLQTASNVKACPAPVISSKVRSAQLPPPSSLASEPDLEYQPPRAITDVVKPVDRVLRNTVPPPAAHRVLRSVQRPAPTPPSAQNPETVPCTWKELSSVEERRQTAEEPEKKRRRVMKHPKFPSSQKVDSQASKSSPGSSIIDTPPKPKPHPNAHLGLQKPAFAIFPHSSFPAPVVQPVEEGESSSSARLPPNGPASQAPFVAFTAAYPDYRGTPGDFGRAAMAIMHLQQTRSLAEFLYDDFIRVFAHSYLDYIERCDEEQVEPLLAIHWYNENVPRPIYNKGIISRGNIADILEHYPIKSVSARRTTDPGPNNGHALLPAARPPVAATSGTEPPGQEELPHDSSLPRKDSAFVPATTSPIVTNGTPLPGPEAVARDSLQPAPPSGTMLRVSGAPLSTGTSSPGVNTHAMLRPDQIERITPLRTVSGYIVTMQGGNDRINLADHTKVKEEDGELPQLLPSPEIPKDRISSNRRAAAGDHTHTGGSANSSSLRQGGNTRNQFAQVDRAAPYRRSKADENTRPKPPPQHQPRVHAVAMDLAAKVTSQDPGLKRKRDDQKGMEPVRRGLPHHRAQATNTSPSLPPGPELKTKSSDKPARPRPKSPPPSYGGVLTQPPATAGTFVSDFTSTRAVESIPETAVKSKDVPRYTIPETVTKPRAAPWFGNGSSTSHVSATGISASKPPASSTVARPKAILRYGDDSSASHVSATVITASKPPASSSVPSAKGKRPKLSKQDRFRKFLEKRFAQGSAPQSTVED